MSNDIFQGNGARIELPTRDHFLIVKETLTRIGIPSSKRNALYQTCCILHKRGEYAIMHFKEMFLLDHRPTSLTEDDIARRNTITNLLAEWNLVHIIDPESTKEPVVPVSSIKIIPYPERHKWTLIPKYTVGVR